MTEEEGRALLDQKMLFESFTVYTFNGFNLKLLFALFFASFKLYCFYHRYIDVFNYKQMIDSRDLLRFESNRGKTLRNCIGGCHDISPTDNSSTIHRQFIDNSLTIHHQFINNSSTIHQQFIDNSFSASIASPLWNG
jgi:hypothetical protein